MQPLLPRYQKSAKGGRSRANLRNVANGIFYVLRTGCQWNAIPREFGTGSTVHRYFQEWVATGVFRKLWKASLLEYDELKGIQWNWQSVDGAMTKSPLGGKKPVRTRLIAASWEPNGPCSPMAGACRWVSRRVAPTRTTSSFFKQPLTAFLSNVRSQPKVDTNTFVSTKATTPRTFASFFVVGATDRTSNLAGRKKRSGRRIRDSKHNGGLLNARIPGSIAFIVYSFAGKKSRKPSCPAAPLIYVRNTQHRRSSGIGSKH
jgi:transposase